MGWKWHEGGEDKKRGGDIKEMKALGDMER